MGDQKRFVGIDVAKAQLEVFIRPDGETFRLLTTRLESASCSGSSSRLTL